jgi:mannose-6-phosphate isomerase-like protein (cupin superfamily)
MDVVNRGNAEHYTWGGASDGWHLLRTEGLSVIEERVPPGGAEVLHYHEKSHQFFYVLAGEAVMELGDRRVRILPRQGLAIPPRVPHRLRNDGPESLSFLVVSAPRSHGDRVNVG